MDKTCIHSPDGFNSHLLANLSAMAPDTTGSWVAGDQDGPVLCDPKYKLRARFCIVCGRVSTRLRESTGTLRKPSFQGLCVRSQKKETQGEPEMKRFAFFTGFLFLTTAIAVPLFFMKKGRVSRQEEDDNIRYDIDDYVAAEGL
jgi:hypothetical protein